jgi:hypothetical protein
MQRSRDRGSFEGTGSAPDIAPLILYSNPRGSDLLSLQEERKGIDRVRQEFNLPESAIAQLHAPNLDDVLKAVARKHFTIIQFSGHGEAGGIYMNDSAASGYALVDVAKVRRILERAQPHLSVAVFLSCFSADMADQLIDLVPLIIAFYGPADDEACARFSESFYANLFSGKHLRLAFNCAKIEAGNMPNIAMLGRSDRDCTPKAMVVHTRTWDRMLRVDISSIGPDLDRLGLTMEEISSRITSQIRYHRWPFRYPRKNALFNVGNYFGRFWWENADDTLYCRRLHRFHSGVDVSVGESWVHLLSQYHNLYNANYRSPVADPELMKEADVKKALVDLHALYNTFILDEAHAALFRPVVSDDFDAARMRGNGALKSADSCFAASQFGLAAGELESALSAIHGLIDAIAKVVLD